MAHLEPRDGDPPAPRAVINGVGFAHAAIEFAALGLVAGQHGCTSTQLHQFAVAVELAFKSLALRAGATLADCERAGHRISRMITLVEQHDVTVPEALKTRLGDDDWFRKFLLMTRYPVMIQEEPPTLENTLFIHKRTSYPEMIAAILEIPCRHTLRFDAGGALAEIQSRFRGRGNGLRLVDGVERLGRLGGRGKERRRG